MSGGLAERKELNMDMEEIRKTCNELHTSLARGYQSTKSNKIEEYSGRFGKGYKVHSHYSKSSKYHLVTYYIYKEV